MLHRPARLFRALALVATLATPVAAQDSAGVDALYDALRMDELIAVMRDEGLAYGETIATDMLGGADAEWDAAVADIYDPERLEAAVRAGLEQTLGTADLDPAIAFFTSEPGRTFVSLELAARQALLDDAVEEAAKEAAALAMADRTPRLQILDRFVAANDLIETNVTGSMNANFAFFGGLGAGGALPDGATEDQLLSDLWAQEPGIRADTVEWIYTYLLLAYSPASDADLETYIAFSETEAGRQVNHGLFTTFDQVFAAISHALGLAAARQMQTEQL